MLLLISLSLLLGCKARDPVEKILKKHFFSYQRDEQQDWLVEVKLPHGRTQQVWVYHTPQEVEGILIRELISPAMIIDPQESALLIAELLKSNYQDELWGNWALLEEDQQQLVVYSIRLSENNLKEHLSKALYYCALKADELEGQLDESMDQF